jgi:hypothetical protein
MKYCRRIAWAGWLVGTATLLTGLVGAAESKAVAAPLDIIDLACDKPLQISRVRVSRQEVLRYDKFEVTFDLQGHWDNPFDPEQVKVDCEFTSPTGKVLIVPGFFYQEYRRTTTSGVDVYQPIGDPVWKLRFAPSVPGDYTYRIQVLNGEQAAATEAAQFTCSPHTANHGFVRISKTNPLYFEYDDGTPFFAIANCKWWDKLSEVETFYTEFARAGGNMTRNFMSRIGELAADRDQYKVPDQPRPDRGFGKMDLDRAWRHDQAFEQCEMLGICQQLAISNGTYFLRSSNDGWRMSVYSSDQGGPLTSPSAKEYLTNPAARENFKRVLRYFVARWGYSTAVFSWNLWNEVDLIPRYDALRSEVIQWHREMVQYLREVDWAGHVIHTNFRTINGDPSLHDLPEMDIVSVNSYRQMDFAAAAEIWTKRHLAAHRKPVMFSEFGLGDAKNPEGYDPHDPDRIMAHNGMWSCMMSGSGGTGMAFGWNWLQNDKYYAYLHALAKYVDGVPFSKRTWQPINVESFRFSDPGQPAYFADVFVEGWSTSYRFPVGWKDREVFRIGPDGRLEDHDHFNIFLGSAVGKSHVVLEMEYPAAGTFAVLVREVHSRTNDPRPPELTASLDDHDKVKETLDVGPGNTLDFYQRYEFPVPAGPRRIRIENSGGGLFTAGYELGGFVRRQGPDLQARGLQTEDVILLWLKSPKLTWLYSRMGVVPEEQSSGKLVLAGVPDGVWVAEWLDTMQDEWIMRTVERAADGKLVLETPPIKRSVAVRLLKVDEACH